MNEPKATDFISGFLNIRDEYGKAIPIVGYPSTERSKYLVIAAPEMLEALQTIIRFCGDEELDLDDPLLPIFRVAEGALAKAKGEADGPNPYADALVFAAAPEMLEALECAEDCRTIEREHAKVGTPMNFQLTWDLRQKWTVKHWEIFEESPPEKGPINLFDLIDLADELRRRALAKAKGEADV